MVKGILLLVFFFLLIISSSLIFRTSVTTSSQYGAMQYIANNNEAYIFIEKAIITNRENYITSEPPLIDICSYDAIRIDKSGNFKKVNNINRFDISLNHMISQLFGYEGNLLLFDEINSKIFILKDSFVFEEYTGIDDSLMDQIDSNHGNAKDLLSDLSSKQGWKYFGNSTHIYLEDLDWDDSDLVLNVEVENEVPSYNLIFKHSKKLIMSDKN